MNSLVRRAATRVWQQWIRPLVVIVVVTTAVRSSLADWYVVPTGSMKPNIIEGDRIFVNKLAYDLKVPFTRWRLLRWADPSASDVVVSAESSDEHPTASTARAARTAISFFMRGSPGLPTWQL